MKQKLFTLLTLLLCVASGAWAATPDFESYNWSSQETAEAVLGTHGAITISGSFSSTANVSGHWYLPIGGALDASATTWANYLAISSTSQIDSISVFYCPNGTNNTSLAWAAWGDKVTPSAEIGTNYGKTTGTKSSKSWDNAVWETIDLSEIEAYTVYISRQLKKFTNNGTNISNFGDNNTINVLGIRVYLKAASLTAPKITTQPASATYMLNDTPDALTVAATASKGDLSYQWYSNSTGTADPENDTSISGATAATLPAENISTAELGTTYYYVVVTDSNGSTTSNVATIEVVSGIAPEVSAAISATATRVNTAVTLTATVSAGTPAPTLQWYTCDADGNNAEAIDGATTASYAYTPTSVGTLYFIVKASNSVQSNVASDVLTLTVAKAGVSGTVSDLVAISEDYAFIADDVTANGKLKPSNNTLYEDSKIFFNFSATVANNKGSHTFAGGTHLNSLRIKNAGDQLVFKVAGPCSVTFYTETPGKSRDLNVGTSDDADAYGVLTDDATGATATLFIPSAGTVYITGSGGDRYFAGFEVSFSEAATISSAKYATYVPTQKVAVPDGVKAYIVSASGDKATLTEVSVIPADEPVVIYKDVNAQTDVAFTYTTADASDVESNELAFYTEDTVADGTQYILADDEDGVGFYKASTGTIAARKAYLPSTSLARFIAFDFGDETTGIDNVGNSMLNVDGCYNLNGQRVAQPTKGLYIVNGKKAIFK